jgi:hypothetical protein
MDNNIYQTPKSELEKIDELPNIQLWNPRVAGAWSLFFTPIFGTVLIKKNWLTLEETGKAKTASIWLYVSILFTVISNWVPIVALIYIVIWYFAFLKKQIDHLNINKITYRKKSWQKPISIALGIYIGIIIFFVLFVMMLQRTI